MHLVLVALATQQLQAALQQCKAFQELQLFVYDFAVSLALSDDGYVSP
jgi:hypothetical protein